ncbi:MAG: hypothetical protein V7K41_22295 [Nostoc sp.]|uniref:hypothetical protein n=1 Tax=Nostoc sp. TaxID=1180 RepID=UPI002FFA1433
MAEPTLVQVFGTGTTQDATTITILKVNLPRLTPSATNTAESLLTGILLKAKDGLMRTTFDTNIDQSLYVEGGFAQFVFRGTNNDGYRVDQLTVSLARPDDASIIDPNNY